MRFEKTNEFKITLKKEQYKFVSSMEKIELLIKDSKNLAYDIYEDDSLIGFALLTEFEDRKYFIWDFAIDENYQQKGFGTKALEELIAFIKNDLKAILVTTTCKTENKVAINFFQKNGFKTYEVVNEGEIRETNLYFSLKDKKAPQKLKAEKELEKNIKSKNVLLLISLVLTLVYVIHTGIACLNLYNCLECSAPWYVAIFVTTAIYIIPLIAFYGLYAYYSVKAKKLEKAKLEKQNN